MYCIFIRFLFFLDENLINIIDLYRSGLHPEINFDVITTKVIRRQLTIRYLIRSACHLSGLPDSE